MNYSKYLKTALAIGLAWLPALFWVSFAGTGIVLGVGSLFSSEPLGGLVFIAIGLGGVLGFLGMTMACWTCWSRQPLTRTFVLFLAFGVMSLLIASGFMVFAGDWDLSDPFTLLQLSYFVACPVFFGLYKIASHVRDSNAH